MHRSVFLALALLAISSTWVHTNAADVPDTVVRRVLNAKAVIEPKEEDGGVALLDEGAHDNSAHEDDSHEEDENDDGNLASVDGDEEDLTEADEAETGSASSLSQVGSTWWGPRRRRRRRRCPSSACPTAQYRAACGCHWCRNKPAASSYTTHGGTNGHCGWACAGGHYRSGSSCRTCASHHCSTGQYRASCHSSSGGHCARCNNGPSHSFYTTWGSTNGVCGFGCTNGYYRSGNSCRGCGGCNAGTRRTGCAGSNAGTCSACPGRPSQSSWTSACLWRCNTNFRKAGNSCPVCPTCGTGQYRSGCRDSVAGSCQSCTAKPSNALWTGHGSYANSCPWKCPDGFYKSGNSCIQCAACSAGQYRTQCGGTSGGKCTGCTNGPPGSTYMSAGTNNGNNCGFDCAPMQYLVGTSCRDCAKCGNGQWRNGCTGSSAGSCAACTNRPDHAIYSGDGGVVDSCDWQCNTNFYRVGNMCTACPLCATGEYRNGCGGNDPGACTLCTSFVPANAFKSDDGGQKNACPWRCNQGWTKSPGAACEVCRTCSKHQWLSGCTHENKGSCTLCSNAKPSHSHYSKTGGLENSCEWSCDAGWYKEGNVCKQCRDCKTGEYNKECGGSNAGTCKVCTNELLGNSHYSSHGGLKNDCPIVCDDSFYLKDQMCAKCEYCQVGFFRKGCGGVSAGACAPCENKLPPHAHHTDHGGYSPVCPWGCDDWWYKKGETCLGCEMCSVGEFKDECGGDSPGNCKACTGIVPVHAAYSTHGSRDDTCRWSCDAVFYKEKEMCLLCETKSGVCPDVPIDCQVSEWSEWGTCDKACGVGSQSRTRTVLQDSALFGHACPGLTHQQECNTDLCSGDSYSVSELADECPADALHSVAGFHTIAQCTSKCDLDPLCTGQIAFSNDRCETSDTGDLKCECSTVRGECGTDQAAGTDTTAMVQLSTRQMVSMKNKVVYARQKSSAVIPSRPVVGELLRQQPVTVQAVISEHGDIKA